MNICSKQIVQLLFFLLVLGAASCTLLQRGSPLMRSGDRYFMMENHRAAAEAYEEVLSTEPNNARALYRAGLSYLAFDKEKASEYLYKAYTIDPAVDADILYWLGRAEHINYRFDEAIAHFKNYHESISGLNKGRKEEALRLMQHARNAQAAIADPKDVFVENMGEIVNSVYSEHSPAISADDNYLLFTTRSKDVTGGIEARDGEYFEDIFETTRSADGTWGAIGAVPGKLNSAGHDASIQLFDNDTKMLLYRAANGGDIFLSERQPDGTWGAPRGISKKVNSKYYEADAHITADGNTLYFSTNQFNKGNNLDLYKVEKQPNGDWGDPVSLGDVINTPYDEDSPFLHPDGRLYFSSRGHNTIGGYDIFVSKYDSAAQQWGKPENLGVPINSPDDDTHYRLSQDGRYAFLSSYRIGGYGEKDIYTINNIRAAEISGKVLSKQDSMAITGVEVRFSGIQANKRDITFSSQTNAETGNYQVTPLSGRIYKVEILKDGKVLASEQYEVPLVLNERSQLTKNFFIDHKSNSGIKGSKVAGQGTGSK